jgi:3-hydroxyacyl-[acyl-carrier-protein] dehydratase
MAEDQTDGAAAPLSFDVTKVMAALPHRYPLLLVDRVLGLVPDESIHAVKAVSMNEQFFQGTSPAGRSCPAFSRSRRWRRPPPACGGNAWAGRHGQARLFHGDRGAKFRNPVEPGCLLHLHVEFTQKRARVCKFAGKAMVDGKVTCEVSFTAMIADS